MKPIYIDYLNALDIEALAMTDAEIIDAVEAGLIAQGNGQTVIEPRVHLEPDPSFHGHFNVLRGYVAPLDAAGVKIVGDYVDNYLHGLPSEFGILNLFDPRTGTPRAILDATVITDMRTGAVTAIGAKHLARKNSKVLAHIGARGTAYWNVRLLDHLFDFDEIRVHSRRAESRDGFAAKLSADLGKKVTAVADWKTCIEGADIVVEASRLPEPQPLLKTEWIKPGALVVPYGTMSAVELSLTDIMQKMVVDDWGQCKGGKFGSPPASSRAGRATTRPSCSGIAACRCPTLRSARRCSPRQEKKASARGCVSHERARPHRSRCQCRRYRHRRPRSPQGGDRPRCPRQAGQGTESARPGRCLRPAHIRAEHRARRQSRHGGRGRRQCLPAAIAGRAQRRGRRGAAG
jgi:ornithine cyclodeaminase